MIWVKLLESLVLGLVRGVLGIKGKDDAQQLGKSIGDDILRRGVHPSARPPPLPDPLAGTSYLPPRAPKTRSSAAPPPIMPPPVARTPIRKR